MPRLPLLLPSALPRTIATRRRRRCRRPHPSGGLTRRGARRNVFARDEVTCLVLDKDTFDAVLSPLQDLLSHNFFVRVLSGIPLFAPLSHEELEAVSMNMVLHEYADGEPIITCVQAEGAGAGADECARPPSPHTAQAT